MTPFSAFLLLTLAMAVPITNAESLAKCPFGCKCERYTDISGIQVRVDCNVMFDSKRGSLNHVPDDLPSDLTQLLLDGQVIERMSSSTFSRYSKLTSLSLKGNKLESLDAGVFSGLSLLKSLDLSSNNLKTIDATVFRDLPKLETLTLENNNLLQMPSFARLPALITFNIGGNNISDCTIPPEIASEKLQRVTVSGCACTTITEQTFANLAGCKMLSQLDVAKTSASKIAAKSFAQLLALESLDLSDNKHLMWSEVQAIEYPPKIKTLQLDNLMQVNSSMNNRYIDFLPVSLETLHINQCGFNGTMPDFRHLTNLNYLYIEGNQFDSLPDVGEGVSGFPGSITYIYARNNKLSHVSKGAFAGLPNLKSVDLSYSQKIKFDPEAFGKQAPSLTDLQLENALKSFPKGLFKSLPNLERLVMDDNEFEDWESDVRDDFDVLVNLKKLQLSGNKLKRLPPGFFKKMNRLTVLYLNDNFLGEQISVDVQGDVFAGLSALEHLDLEENDILTLHPKVFSQIDGSQVRSISLLGNRLKTFPSEALAVFPKLSLVNMDGNDIVVLTANDFSKVPPTCIVNLWSNPIDCSCDNYEFFRWMETTNPNTDRPNIKELKCRTPAEWNEKNPPPVARLSTTCANSAGSTAVIVFFVVICVIVVITLLAYFAARKLKHYFPYKRLAATSGGDRRSQLVTSVPHVHMSGLDDADDAFQM